mgnify:CR=1 FL=1
MRGRLTYQRGFVRPSGGDHDHATTLEVRWLRIGCGLGQIRMAVSYRLTASTPDGETVAAFWILPLEVWRDRGHRRNALANGLRAVQHYVPAAGATMTVRRGAPR